MKVLLLLPLLSLPLLVCAAASEATDDRPALAEPAPLAWQHDLDRAAELAAESDRPLMIVFR